VRFRSRFFVLLAATLALTLAHQALAQTEVPRWLQKHVGYDDGQIAPLVLARARAHHRAETKARKTRNSCYMAMDATRPSTMPSGQPGKRFFVICEKRRSFRAMSSGYGNGRKLQAANFANGRQCARHFSNAEGSKLTAGGAYVTAEHRTSFKGYYSQSGQRTPFYRTFLLFDGRGETSNARERAIGGHQAMFLRWQCRFPNQSSRHADAEGYTPFGRLVDYTSGRSNGCTTWSATDTREILAMTKDNPTALYIYPESKDIRAVTKAVQSGQSPRAAGTYWNTTCLAQIGTPRFWPKRELQPIINSWRRSLPPPSGKPLPICQ